MNINSRAQSLDEAPAEKATPDQGDTAATLKLLASLAEAPSISQRGLAGRLGVALGLANAYLKRAATKGWIKMRQAPARRYLYYLTPEGFAEKAALTREYLSDSLTFFRRVRQQSADALTEAEARGCKRIAFYGCGDLAEIAGLSARERGLDLAGIIDPKRNAERFNDIPVFRSLSECGPVDAVMITDMIDPQAAFDHLRAEIGEEKLLLLPLLHVVRRVEGEADEPAAKDTAA